MHTPLIWVPPTGKSVIMKIKYTYWQESDGTFLGFLNSHPDHWTQGPDLADLQLHLKDVHATFANESIPEIKTVAELEVA